MLEDDVSTSSEQDSSPSAVLPVSRTSDTALSLVTCLASFCLRLLGGAVGGGEKDNRLPVGGSLDDDVVLTQIFGKELLLADFGISMVLSISGSTREALSSLCL